MFILVQKAHRIKKIKNEEQSQAEKTKVQNDEWGNSHLPLITVTNGWYEKCILQKKKNQENEY